ncbi:MAG: cell division protein FtsZ [Dehalococcoidia bacterium]|nr:cell division protein FtsZ [Dehalococcoidia bacterium]
MTRTAVNTRVKSIESAGNLTQIKVIGVGGGGSNAVNRMIEEGLPDIEFISVNTDAQALVRSIAPTRIRIGDRLTRGLGVGGDHKLGMLAADESREEVAKVIHGADLLFITAGMGGGTGTGAAPVLAEVARLQGILTIAVVTMPFGFEGSFRARVAEEGIIRLKERADTIIAIPNERLLSLCDTNVSIDQAFKMVDSVLLSSVQGISEVITTCGHINLDFNDVRATMSEAGYAWIGMGYGEGKTRAADAARGATVSPLFEYSIENAKRILFNVVGNDLGLSEVNEAANLIRDVADPTAQIIFGLATDPKLGKKVKITLIATGFKEHKGLDEGEDIASAGEMGQMGMTAAETTRRRSFFPWSR